MQKAHKEAIITHMKYIIRDTLFYNELLDIREYKYFLIHNATKGTGLVYSYSGVL